MKTVILRFLITYFLFVLLFALQKPVFILYHYDIYDTDILSFLNVIWHGLPLDLCMAGYLTVIPGLLLLLSVWIKSSAIRYVRMVYFIIIAVIISIIYVIDLALYRHWGFRLDATPVFYFLSSPKDAVASTDDGTVPLLTGVALFFMITLYIIFYFALIRGRGKQKITRHRFIASIVLLLMTAMLFIPIRGGFTVSTMNMSAVYFSQNQRLNHAAINPIFSFMYSMTHQTGFDKQYRFMDSQKADDLFAELVDKPVEGTDTVPELFSLKRPNIIVVILESFSTHLMESMGGTPNVAVNMDRLGAEGVLFTNFYANSFRTDRGLVSILSGYPAQPTTSIMKYTKKIENLPSIPKHLQKNGYELGYYYGGDAGFTNMRTYLVACGFLNIVSDKDFTFSERNSKWGAHDHLVFNRLLDDIATMKQDAPPFLKIIQTSSSHEPFEVPFYRLEDPALNAFAYTDSCLGDFVARLRQTPLWEKTVLVLVPDHQGGYPHPADPQKIESHTIPMIFAGGAVREACQIDTYGSQTDLAATLLAQLGIDHATFTFSKNILNRASPHFGYFTVPNVFGMITPENRLVFNCESNTVQTDEGSHKSANLESGKAYLQKLYDDLERR